MQARKSKTPTLHPSRITKVRKTVATTITEDQYTFLIMQMESLNLRLKAIEEALGNNIEGFELVTRDSSAQGRIRYVEFTPPAGGAV